MEEPAMCALAIVRPLCVHLLVLHISIHYKVLLRVSCVSSLVDMNLCS